MNEKECRVFLSYRGNSEGKAFCERLYSFLKSDPAWEQIYGEIFYSPQSAKLGHNFKKDLKTIMRSVKFFVMPLTQGYYDDFMEKNKRRPNDNSITYHEIHAALEAGSRFICIGFPGCDVESDSLLKKLFGKDFDRITCSIRRQYDPEKEKELFLEISDSILRDDYNVTGMADIMKNCSPNVFMSFKEDTEEKVAFPFYQKLYDVKKITLLNYASTSFVSGMDIASIYEESDFLKRWFSYHLIKGDIEADIVLTAPHSSAAYDAALYKMYPDGLTKNTSDIILHNLNTLFRFKRTNPEAKLNVYLTQIALPYGVMMTEHRDPKNNHIKADLYAAVTGDDGRRPSFYLMKQDATTKALYVFFRENVKRIMREYSFPFNGHPDVSWLLNKEKPIIHRAVIRGDMLPHSRRSYDACIGGKYPVEVDLLQMRDGTIIVARDDFDLRPYGIDKRLSEFDCRDLRDLNSQMEPDRILTLDEFLEYIGGKIPLLIEIKTDGKEMTPQLENYTDKIVKKLQQYADQYCHRFSLEYASTGTGLAVHSADPNVLQRIKTLDCTIPCGIITRDFSDIKEEVGEEFCQMHAMGSYTEIVAPDFISCDVNYLQSGPAMDLCEKLQIPLLGWTVRDGESQHISEDYNCSNMIIEGRKSYL